MAETRMIKTKMWRDAFIRGLNEKGKTLWLYLLTNDHTHICGFYELTLDAIAFESGLKEKDILEQLELFHGKIEYIDNYVCIKNYVRHQNAACSPKVQIAIDRSLKDIPENVKNVFENSEYKSNSKSKSKSKSKSEVSIPYGKGIDTLYKSEYFQHFWDVYPKKVGKGETWKSWQRIAPTKELARKIYVAVMSYKNTEQWHKDNGQFIPNPATFLNQRRFDDDIRDIKIENSKYDGV